jgi:hypothetical protein
MSSFGTLALALRIQAAWSGFYRPLDLGGNTTDQKDVQQIQQVASTHGIAAENPMGVILAVRRVRPL